jgi:hypothetical protein
MLAAGKVVFLNVNDDQGCFHFLSKRVSNAFQSIVQNQVQGHGRGVIKDTIGQFPAVLE